LGFRPGGEAQGGASFLEKMANVANAANGANPAMWPPANVANAANVANVVLSEVAVPPRRDAAVLLWPALFAAGSLALDREKGSGGQRQGQKRFSR